MIELIIIIALLCAWVRILNAVLQQVLKWMFVEKTSQLSRILNNILWAIMVSLIVAIPVSIFYYMPHSDSWICRQVYKVLFSPGSKILSKDKAEEKSDERILHIWKKKEEEKK